MTAVLTAQSLNSLLLSSALRGPLVWGAHADRRNLMDVGCRNFSLSSSKILRDRLCARLVSAKVVIRRPDEDVLTYIGRPPKLRRAGERGSISLRRS